MRNPNRTYFIALFISLFLNVLFIIKLNNPPELVEAPDPSKWENKIDSLKEGIKKKDSIVAALKVGIEAKAETVFVNQKKVENDISIINKYTNISQLLDSLYAAR